MTMATTSPNCRLSLVLIVSRMTMHRLKPVTDAANRFDRFTAEWHVDLLAKITDEDIEDVGIPVKVVVPRMFEKLLTGDNRPDVHGQQLQQGVFFSCQTHLGLAPPYRSGRRVDLQ